MPILSRAIAVIAASLALAACGDDAIVGTWEAKDDSSVDLEVEADGDDYSGEGHIYLCTGPDCFLCSFDFELREHGDDRWEMEGDFTDDCTGEFEDVECELEDDDTELHCDLPGGGTIEYDKQE